MYVWQRYTVWMEIKLSDAGFFLSAHTGGKRWIFNGLTRIYVRMMYVFVYTVWAHLFLLRGGKGWKNLKFFLQSLFLCACQIYLELYGRWTCSSRLKNTFDYSKVSFHNYILYEQPLFTYRSEKIGKPNDNNNFALINVLLAVANF